MDFSQANFLPFFSSFSVWLVIKVFACFALFLYSLFAFVVVKQVNQMTQVLKGPGEEFLKFIAWAHFLIACFILVFAILFL